MLDTTQKLPAEQKPQSANKLKQWFNQPNNRNVFAVLGLGFFFVMVMVGVLIAQRQLLDRTATAPNAPVSEPQAKVASCSLTYTVPQPSQPPQPTPGPTCFRKMAFYSETTDSPGNYALTRFIDPANGGSVKAGDLIVYHILLSGLNNQTTIVTDQLPANVEFEDATSGCVYTATQHKVVCTFDTIKPADIRVQVKAQTATETRGNETGITGNTDFSSTTTTGGRNNVPANQFRNTAYVSNNPANQGTSSCILDLPYGTTATPLPTYQCNSVCTTHSQCQTVDPNYICYKATANETSTNNQAGRCRLKVNPSAPECKAPSPSPSPTPSVRPTPSPTPSVSPSPTPTVVPTPTPTQTPSYACNATCATDEQCRGVNAGYICHPDLKVCRLDTNRTNASCQPAQNTYACNSACSTNAQCQTANGGYICSNGQCRLDSNPTATSCLPNNYVPPTPAVGCNVTCSSNADCSNPSHICSTTADGTNRCRLADYVNSATCSKPPESTPATPGTQPELPEQLPQTGAFEVGKWLQAGLAALGIGAVLLLFL